jgi:hypothetical protein
MVPDYDIEWVREEAKAVQLMAARVGGELVLSRKILVASGLTPEQVETLTKEFRVE